MLGLGGGILGASLVTDSDGTTPSTIHSEPVAVGVQEGALDVGVVLDALQSSVVSIETTIDVGHNRFRGPAEAEGAGTGIVLDDSGHILTNAHVVGGATSIMVTASDGSSPRPATVIATDDEADIAVLVVEDTTGLRPAEIAEAGTTEVGDQVVAIGNALALDGSMTVTQGIISAVDRTLETQSGTLTDLIQTDAAISSGNSGGPLVNDLGQVVGINTAVATSGGGVQASNVGFAIAIDSALEVASDLVGQG